jgi:prevent-host-death family protein
MAEVGVRELRDHLSRWLARVQAGEEVVVTDRGRRIARITSTAQSRYDELVAAGLVTPPRTRDRSPPKPIEGEGPVSTFVADQRR